jgi:hypothetical protein
MANAHDCVARLQPRCSWADGPPPAYDPRPKPGPVGHVAQSAGGGAAAGIATVAEVQTVGWCEHERAKERTSGSFSIAVSNNLGGRGDFSSESGAAAAGDNLGSSLEDEEMEGKVSCSKGGDGGSGLGLTEQWRHRRLFGSSTYTIGNVE